MKKLFVLLLIVLLFTFPSCKESSNEKSTGINIEKSNYLVNIYDGAAMKIVENTVTSSGLTVEFSYIGSNTGMYGYMFIIEVNKEEIWVKQPFINKNNNGVFPSEGFMIKNGEKRKQQIDWKWLYGDLPNGHYRIIKGISDFREAGKSTQYYLAAEFTIK